MARVVYLVHGIRDAAGNGRPNDDWFDRLELALRPHFQCERIRYREYQDLLLGGPALFLWPWLPLLVVCAILLASDWIAAGALMALIVPVFVSIRESQHWTGCWPCRSELVRHGIPFVAGSVVTFLAAWHGRQEIMAAAALAAAGWYIADIDFRSVSDSFNSRSRWALNIIASGVAGTAGWSIQQLGGPALLGVLLMLLIFGAIEPQWRRRRATTIVHERIRSGLSSPFDRPHVIAHSLGTIISLQVMRQVTMQRWGSLLCVGSVLPSDTDWRPLLGDSANLLEVHNEAGMKDGFVRAAGALQPLLKRWNGLGGGGYRGFSSPLGSHDCAAIAQPCPWCVDGEGVRIHNWGVGENRHSTSLLTEDHALYAWLPMLWGWHPACCNDLFERAEAAIACRHDGDTDGFLDHATRVGSLRAWWRPLDSSRRRVLDYAESCLRDAVSSGLGQKPAPTGDAFWAANPSVYFDFFHSLFKHATFRAAEASSVSAGDLKRKLRMAAPIDVINGALKDTLAVLQNRRPV